MKPASELRLDLVSNDWVVIATGRARRPETFAQHKRVKETVSPKDCPFCQPQIIEQGVQLRYDKPDGAWDLLVVNNKYPAFSQGESLHERSEGPNKVMDGIGFHEIIITRDHEKQIAQFSVEEVKQVVDAYQARYLDLMNKKFVKYISIFHNHGREAGASIAHPHSQLIAIPVMDPDLRGSVEGAERYYKENKKCVYCTMIDWDIKDGRRIIYENEKFVVLCPFAPMVSFEVRVYPKEHQPYFEEINEEEKGLFAEALKEALSRIYQGLDDPAYNFYIHTAPCDKKNYTHYHWHLNILPKTAVWAGFELGTGIEISTIEPEKAAEFLRKQQ
jgi:UDPglucose--hexose-1-phosphate uridylyltransferase